MKEYRLTLTMQFVFGIGLAGGIVGVATAAWATFNNKFEIAFILMMLYFGYVIYFFGKILFVSQIIITEKTITYKSHGAKLVANWEDILRIGAKDRLFVHMEGLYIPSESNSKAFIPLSYFSESWRDSELGQQIKQYAPHLLFKK